MPAAAAAAVKPLISPTLLNRVASVLDEHGILHGELVEGPAHLNLNASDRRRVFIKVTRPGDAHDRAHTEVAAATWARAHNIPCPSPLLNEPVEVTDEYGQSRAVTVWTWAEPVACPSLIDRGSDVLDIIEKIASTPAAPCAVPFDLPFYISRVRDRLGSRFDALAETVLASAEVTGARVADLMIDRPVFWSHSDLHLLNVGWGIAGTPVVFDWESSSLAPVEFDVAQLLRSVMADTPGYAATERDRVARVLAARADARFDLDWRLVAALVRFRTASSMSHRLTRGDNPAGLAADLALLESPLEWLPL